MNDFERETARMLKLIMYALETPCSDRSDVTTVAARVKKMRSDDETFTKLVHDCCDMALLFGYFDDSQADDRDNLVNATQAVLKVLNLKYKAH
jgi:hypothetical protein